MNLIYDFGMIMKEFKFDLSAIMELLKRKEIRKPYHHKISLNIGALPAKLKTSLKST